MLTTICTGAGLQTRRHFLVDDPLAPGGRHVFPAIDHHGAKRIHVRVICSWPEWPTWYQPAVLSIGVLFFLFRAATWRRPTSLMVTPRSRWPQQIRRHSLHMAGATTTAWANWQDWRRYSRRRRRPAQ